MATDTVQPYDRPMDARRRRRNRKRRTFTITLSPRRAERVRKALIFGFAPSVDAWIEEALEHHERQHGWEPGSAWPLCRAGPHLRSGRGAAQVVAKARRVRPLTLDAGALIAFDRGDPSVQRTIQAALDARTELAIPAGALGQAWRDGRRQVWLARLVKDPRVIVRDSTRRRPRPPASCAAAARPAM